MSLATSLRASRMKVWGNTREGFDSIPPSDAIIAGDDGLLTHNSVDEYYRYPYVYTGYRKPNMTRRECFDSLWLLHNQLFNALTMMVLWPLAIAYTFIGLYVVSTPLQTHIALLFLLQWYLHSPFSVVYHVFQTIDVDVAKRLCRLDYGSIFVVCVVGLYINTFYAFNSYTTLRVVLLTVSLTISGVFLIITASPSYDDFCLQRKFMLMGPAVQIALNLFPIFYSEYRDGGTQAGLPAILITLNWVVCAVVWLSHFPEKWFPVMFDKYTHSHTVMHLHLVVFQGLQWWYLVASAAEYTDGITHSV